MKKFMPIEKERFESMFTDTEKVEIKDTLKAYDRVEVEFENGQFHFSTGSCLRAKYAPDHEFIGTVYADDIFTEEERIVNYVEAFHSFPIGYKGKRDYRMFEGLDWSAKFALVDGNIVRA